ncbi:MAG: flagellin [Deltaproteobacteria bacterium]|nr:flagellin [Deltaproteobacteria bacterium]
MALRVNSNVAALNALRHLNHTEKELSGNLERLSSGRRLNRAADGPAELVISEQMKAQITGLEQSIRNSETSISMIQTTEGALSEVSSILINLRQLAVHSANEATNDEKMLQANQGEIENLLVTLSNISKNTQFGTRTLLDGSNSVSGVAVGDGMDFVEAKEFTKASPAEGYKINVTQPATRSMAVAENTLAMEDIYKSFVISEGGRTVEVNVRDNLDLYRDVERLLQAANTSREPGFKEKTELALQQLVANEMQRQIDQAGLNLEVMVYKPLDTLGETLSDFNNLEDVLNKLEQYPSEEILSEFNKLANEEVIVIRHREYGSEPTFTVTTEIDDFFDMYTPANKAVTAIPGRDVEGTIGGNPEFDGGEPAIGRGQLLSAAPGTVAEGVTVRYGGEPDDIIYEVFNRRENKIAGTLLRQMERGTMVGEDIDGYVHVSQRSLAFQVGPSEGQQRKISIQSISPTKLARNIDNDSQFRSLNDIEVLDVESAQDALKLIDVAVGEISSLRGDLGSFQKNALESNLSSLRVTRENLVSAESTLADADMAEEMSSLVRNQILMSSGTAMLAQANQVPQSVLTLLERT